MADRLHKKALEEQKKINSEAEFLAEKISGHVCEIICSTDDDGHLYGSVSERTISEKLVEAGFDVDSGHVLLHEHIKVIGEFIVPIKVYGDIRAEMKIIVKSDNKNVVIVKPKTEPVVKEEVSAPAEDESPGNDSKAEKVLEGLHTIEKSEEPAEPTETEEKPEDEVKGGE